MFNDHNCEYPVFGQINHKLAGTLPRIRMALSLTIDIADLGGLRQIYLHLKPQKYATLAVKEC